MYDFGYIATEAKRCHSFSVAGMDDVSVSTKIDSIVTVAEAGLTDIIEFYNK